VIIRLGNRRRSYLGNLRRNKGNIFIFAELTPAGKIYSQNPMLFTTTATFRLGEALLEAIWQWVAIFAPLWPLSNSTILAS